MRTKLLLVISLLLTSISITFAQNDFREGYVVTNTNDTLFGEINLRSNILNAESCQFRNDGEIKTYKPFEIYSYRFNEDKYYVSKEIEIEEVKKSVFLEFLVEGITNLYYLKYHNEDYYFLEKEDQFVLLDNREIQIEKDGKDYVKNSGQYKGAMRYLFRDAPALSQRIGDVDFNYKPLINITKAYHNAVCDEYSCVDYTKSTEAPVNIELIAGGGLARMSLYNSSEILSCYSPKLGANFIFKPLRAFYRWNFEVGLSYERNHFSGKITDYSGFVNDYLDLDMSYITQYVPIKVRYEFPEKKVQPYISAGLLTHLIVYQNTEIVHYLSTFYKPKYIEADLRMVDYSLTAAIGVKVNREDSGYWLFEGNFRRQKMFGNNTIIDGMKVDNISLTLGYGFTL